MWSEDEVARVYAYARDERARAEALREHAKVARTVAQELTRHARSRRRAFEDPSSHPPGEWERLALVRDQLYSRYVERRIESDHVNGLARAAESETS